MRGKTAHRVECDRVAGNRFVLAAPGIGPGNRQLDLLITRGNPHFVRQTPDRSCSDTGYSLGPFRRVLFDALLEQLKRGFDAAAVVECELSHQARIGAGTVRVHRALQVTVPPELVFRLDAGFFDHLVRAHEQAAFVSLRFGVDQIRRVRVLEQEIPIVEA